MPSSMGVQCPQRYACDTLPNVSPLFFKEQEAGCLVGAVAGQMEMDGKLKRRSCSALCHWSSRWHSCPAVHSLYRWLQVLR